MPFDHNFIELNFPTANGAVRNHSPPVPNMLDLCLRPAWSFGLAQQKRLALGMKLYNSFPQFRHCRYHIAEPGERILACRLHTVKADTLKPFDQYLFEYDFLTANRTCRHL